MISEVTPAIKAAILKIVEEYQQQKEVKISQELKVLTLELKHQRELIQQSIDNANKRFESIDKRFESIDKRFESIDKRFESIDKRFEEMRHYSDKRFEAMDKRFEDMKYYMDKRFTALFWMMGIGFTALGTLIALIKL